MYNMYCFVHNIKNSRRNDHFFPAKVSPKSQKSSKNQGKRPIVSKFDVPKVPHAVPGSTWDRSRCDIIYIEEFMMEQ